MDKLKITPEELGSIGVSNPGVDYFNAPNVIITGGGGAGARAKAVLAEKNGRIIL